jgi:hypothetical protein
MSVRGGSAIHDRFAHAVFDQAAFQINRFSGRFHFWKAIQ